MKRTPLARGTPLRRAPWPKGRKGQSQRYRGNGNDKRKRRACMRVVAARSGGQCEAQVPAVCTSAAIDGHEVLPRSAGGSHMDPANVLHVCRRCHDWIHAHPRESRELGLLQSRYASPSPRLLGRIKDRYPVATHTGGTPQ